MSHHSTSKYGPYHEMTQNGHHHYSLTIFKLFPIEDDQDKDKNPFLNYIMGVPLPKGFKPPSGWRLMMGQGTHNSVLMPFVRQCI